MDSLPVEIMTYITHYLSFKDLVRAERTCKLLQSYSLSEIEKRVQKSSTNEWGMLIHLNQVSAKPIRFDPVTKKAYYSVQMDPVTIKSMFDRQRPIHCSLLRKCQANQTNDFKINIQKGMIEGQKIQLNVENELCQVLVDLVRLPQPPKPIESVKSDSISSLAPAPLNYTLQITELSLPLSTIAA